MKPSINRVVLMSGADYFDNRSAINAYMDANTSVDRLRAHQEHTGIKGALQAAGVEVIQVAAPAACQDGIYTANWALIKGNKAVLARLPRARQAEEQYAKSILQGLGKEVIMLPDSMRFSGQGDALPCGRYLFAGSGYRSDPQAQIFVAEQLGYMLVQLHTVPQLDGNDKPVINTVSGWSDSFFYDIDLALAVLRLPTTTQTGLIAWCPPAFIPESQQKIRALTDIETIEVSLDEATKAFACNLVSTGETLIMSAHAPGLQAKVLAAGFKVITPEVTELTKGGGYIRCTTLTVD